MKKLDELEVVKAKTVEQSGKTMDEVNLLIGKKKEELEFLINDIAAVHIIAKDLKVDLTKPLQKIIDPLDKVVDRIAKESMSFGYLDALLSFDREKAKQIIREELFDDKNTVSILKFATPIEYMGKKHDELVFLGDFGKQKGKLKFPPELTSKTDVLIFEIEDKEEE